MNHNNNDPNRSNPPPGDGGKGTHLPSAPEAARRRRSHSTEEEPTNVNHMSLIALLSRASSVPDIRTPHDTPLDASDVPPVAPSSSQDSVRFLRSILDRAVRTTRIPHGTEECGDDDDDELPFEQHRRRKSSSEENGRRKSPQQ